MLKYILTIAVLGLFLGVGSASQANAASFTPATAIDTQLSKATGENLTRVGSGWWVVPAVVGGVILYHHCCRHRHYYYRCYRRCWYHRGHRHCRRYC